jgi:phage terminase large subunit
MEVVIRLPPKLKEVFRGRADVRGAYGGRGSAKTRSFAKMAAFYGMRFGQAGVTGQLLCARQYMNSLDDSSLEEVKRAIEDEPLLAAYYDVGEKYIKSRDGRVSFAFAGLDRSINSVKSKGRILLCWVDEAEPVTDTAWDILEPTLREENEGWNAELWVTWNPARKEAPVEKRYRKSADPLIKMAEMNWRDNPKFPAVLERKRQRCLKENPDQYEHIWEGAYVTVVKGAYYAKQLTECKAQGRIGVVAADPLLTLRVHCDIGGTGQRSDAFSMWVNQFAGLQVRALDYYESQGQELGEHLGWLRRHGYTPERTTVVLPHDGAQNDKVHRVSYESAFREAGYKVVVVPNMGTGAAKSRIETARRVFPQVWFNNSPTDERTDATGPGRDALGWYHEKIDEDRGIGLGPDHDWSSHAADAFGLMAVDYTKQQSAQSTSAPLNYRRLHG